jgi:hypothetical protein
LTKLKAARGHTALLLPLLTNVKRRI